MTPCTTFRSFRSLAIQRAALSVFALMMLPFAAVSAQDPAPARRPFGIQVIDEATGRGVPLIELRTVNEIPFVTDSAGWVAFDEPGLMDREVYFAISGPGYEAAADGFGFRGVRLTTKPGGRAEVKVKRVNIAERLYRLTGQGIYRDSELLGVKLPDGASNLNAGVVGQDSVQAVPYRDRLFWLWGDTNVPNYALGNFNTTSATSPAAKDLRPEVAIPFTYYTDPEHPERLRKMAPLSEPGPVWLFGLLNIKDDQGRETLLSHYTRQVNLAKTAEHGLMRFDDEAGVFKVVKKLDLNEKWRFPNNNAFLVKEPDGDYYYFAVPFASVRVKADWASVTSPEAYEALVFNADSKQLEWQQNDRPTTQQDEAALIAQKKLARENARQSLVDAATGEPVAVHTATIAWNEHRRRWIILALQATSNSNPSYIGEMWYAEADHPSGPWGQAVKIATHPKYSFYNPRLHSFLDAEGGRIVYFEGTYTHTFSNAPFPTARYDYNQILYKLDLSDERLKAAH